MGSSIKSTAHNIMSKAGNIIFSAWNGIKDTVHRSCDFISNLHEKLHEAVNRSNSSMMNDAKATFHDGYSAVQDATNVFHDIITGKWGNVKDDIVKLVHDLRDMVHDIFTGVYDRLNDLTHGSLSKIKEKRDNPWQGFVNSIKNACSSSDTELQI